MKNLLITALVAAIVALVAKIIYDVRKHISNKKAFKNATLTYVVRVTSVSTEAIFFVATEEEATQIALDWRDRKGVTDLKCGYMVEQEAQLYKDVLVKACGYKRKIGANGAEMYVENVPTTKTRP